MPESIERASAAADDMAETLKGLDADAIAQRASFELLKRLAEGLATAAESRKPEG